MSEHRDDTAKGVVKQLEWRPVEGGMGGFVGKKQYRFIGNGWGGWEWQYATMASQEAAQAAAQAHFEAEVREMASMFSMPKGDLDE
jgi:hypothetical protein